MKADRNADGIASTGVAPDPAPAELLKDPTTNSFVTGPLTRNNWYPINMYDAREGEFREAANGAPSCAIGGVLNLVEIDVNNLRRWLLGNIGASGPNVEFTTQNGYILYVSDRRGMIASPKVGFKNGEYGFEDVINPAS